jgi:lipopolysaccharide/colanic/teichoic acid biosynthesis glycosyltransferase
MSSTLQRVKSHRVRSTASASAAPQSTGVVPSSYFAWKNWLERGIALVLLPPSSLIILVLVIIVRLTSPGPGIYRQIRVGRHGRTFMMYKIRTMRQDAEAATGPVWAKKGDSRITPVGRVLRRLHLDEFPQLMNVLRGEMSQIGPRPERPEFTQRLARDIPGYLERLKVLPGITGLAQINLPPDTDLESVRRKLVLDLEYIRQADPWLDLRMFLCTGVRLLGVHGDPAMRMFWLHRHVVISPDKTSTHSGHGAGEKPVLPMVAVSQNGHAGRHRPVDEKIG